MKKRIADVEIYKLLNISPKDYIFNFFRWIVSGLTDLRLCYLFIR